MFTVDYIKNKNDLVTAIGPQSDFVTKSLYISSLKRRASFYSFGEMDEQKLDRCLHYMNSLSFSFFENRDLKEEQSEPMICLAEATTSSVEEAVSFLFQGQCIMLLEGIPFAYAVHLKKEMQRHLEESTTERVIRGPHASFIEDVDQNIALIRQFADDQNLIAAKHLVVDAKKEKKIFYMFNKDKTDPIVIDEVKERLSQIKQANIEDSGKIESFLDPTPLYSPFIQVQSSDRVDRILAGFEEGRVAIFVDGSPFAFMVPTTFEQQMQAPDDYYQRWMISSIIRLLRYVALFITLFAAPIYIALVSFHQGLIPNELSVTIMNSRLNVPFPPVGEVILLTLFVDLLREASIRLPNQLGQTIGLVGGVVIGQAVVEANLVSSIMVIIIAVTAIASFAVPLYSLSMSFRFLSFIAIAFASIVGLFGVIVFFILITIHLASLRNFGVHYFSFTNSLKYHGYSDFLIRLPTLMKDKKG
ncbi:spore germination protein [Alkalihalophilus lindianensis]|uniref:Spore germination protein n=1 Tax=Alkalihalophilus lindianensis TaxID=1630542 RepID=A0ABU3XEZ5_9BACI|nr:spore germination protein [Alkalihalophilus lindianensis]MDV2686475.1 spore germination protein [Alkalihalophilus lindianensis]